MADLDMNPRWDLDYQFTVTGGSVTGVQAIFGHHAVDLHLPRGATFTVDGASITSTLHGWNSTQVVTFTPEAGSTSLYEISDIKTSFANLSTARGGYEFSLYDGVVKGAPDYVVTHHGQSTYLDPHTPLDAIFATDGSSIVEQYAHGNEVDTITYVQPAGSDLYAIASTERSFIDAGTSTTHLDVVPQDRMQFTFDGAGGVAQAQRLDAQGGVHTVADAHVTYSELAPGYVEQVTTYGAHSSYAVYYEGSSADGTFSEIAHGSGSSVDLAGLQAQVAQAEHLLPTGSYTTTGWVI